MATSPDPDKTFLGTLGGVVVTSLPVVSTAVFFAVTIKVFRVANMETATTVAVVSQADVIQLLKGVVLTLLPGFLASLVAACIWWWAGEIPEFVATPDEAGTTAYVKAASHAASFANPRFILVLAALVISFFTLPWSVMLVFLVPVACAATLMRLQSHRHALGLRWARHVLRGAALLMSFAMIASLALSSTVWLPVRAIELQPGVVVELQQAKVSGQVAGYILGTAGEQTSILLHEPRAVVTVPTKGIAPNPPLCVFRPSPFRWALLRGSQVLGFDPDFGSPYVNCPE